MVVGATRTRFRNEEGLMQSAASRLLSLLKKSPSLDSLNPMTAQIRRIKRWPPNTNLEQLWRVIADSELHGRLVEDCTEVALPPPSASFCFLPFPSPGVHRKSTDNNHLQANLHFQICLPDLTCLPGWQSACLSDWQRREFDNMVWKSISRSKEEVWRPGNVLIGKRFALW